MIYFIVCLIVMSMYVLNELKKNTMIELRNPVGFLSVVGEKESENALTSYVPTETNERD